MMANFTHTFNESAEVYGQLSYLDSGSGQTRPVHVGPIEPKYALPGILTALQPGGLVDTAGGLLPTGGGLVAIGAPATGFGSNPANDPSNILLGGSTIPDIGTALAVLAERQLIQVQSQQRLASSYRWNSLTMKYACQASMAIEASTLGTNKKPHAQLGLRGDFEIGDRPWSYDFSVTHGESNFQTHFLGLDSDRLELAHYGLGGPNCVPDGDLSNPFARGLIAGGDGIIDTSVGTPGAKVH